MKKISIFIAVLFLLSLFTNTAFAVSTLKYGSKGNDVKLLQTKLIKLGYMKGTATGLFKDATKAAVIKFQKQNGIPATGVVSTLTWNALNKRTSSPQPSRGSTIIIKRPTPSTSVADNGETQNPSQTKPTDTTTPGAVNIQTPVTTPSGITQPGGNTNATTPPAIDVTEKPLTGKIVIIDPGHGFKDPGAARGSIYEKTFNLNIGLALKGVLEDSGATVIMTRSTDGSSGENSLYYRSAVANNAVLEIEMNSIIQEENEIQSQISSLESTIASDQIELDSIKQTTTGSGIEDDQDNGQKISQLEQEIADLTQQTGNLKTKLNQKNASISDLQSKINTFNQYISSPSLGSRVGIMALGQGSAANKKLADVFDLENKKYSKDVVFIAIHCNSTSESETSASGTHVLVSDNSVSYYKNYYKGYNQAKRDVLGQFLLKEINANTKFSKKTTKISRQDLSVLRENNLVSALVEVGYINNSSDRKLLSQSQTILSVATGISKGIEDYFESQN